MTATLVNTDGSKRIVLDGEIVCGAGLDFGPLPDAKSWLDASAGSGAGVGGYPAAYYLALENATGVLDEEHISTLNADKLYGSASLVDVVLSGQLAADFGLVNADLEVNGALLLASALDLSSIGAGPPFVLHSLASLVTYLNADKVDGYHASGLGRLDTSGTWALSQIFNAAASFQSATVPFVVVGTDRVDNLTAHYLGAVSQDSAYFLARSHHTGTQLAATISDFASAVGALAQPLDATLTALAGVTSTAGGMLYSTGADAFSNLANPGAAAVLTHNGTIPVWVTALAKAQQNAQTAYLDGTANTFTGANNKFQLLTRIGSQTAGAGLVVGDQSAVLDAGSLTSNLGLTIYADVAGTANAFNFDNRSTSGSAGLGIQYLMVTSASVTKRACSLVAVKNGAWTDGTLSTQDADFILYLAKSGVITETLRVSGKGNVVPGTAALATSATDGFTYIQTCAGAPTGVPSAYTGRAATVYDSTNNKLYVYNGAWKSVTLT